MRNEKGQFVKGYGFWKGKKRPGLKTSTTFEKGHKTWNKNKLCPQISNEKNGTWKGEAVGYIALHAWVARKLGKPSLMENKQKILILGAFGLVGKNLCKKLETDFPNIEITKIKFNEGISGLPTCHFDYTIFCAGYGQPQKFLQHKIETIQLNTDSVMCCFNKLKPDGKFLYVSSSEIYSGAPSPHKETDIGTTTPQHPRACYIEGKRCGEAICMAYKEQGYDVKIARLALAYGPGTKKGDTRVLNQFIEQILSTGNIRMKDDGSAVRTYGYIDDVVKQLLFVLFESKGVVYNVGGESTLSIRDLAFKIQDITGGGVIMGTHPLEGAPEIVRSDLTKLHREMNYYLTPIEEGLKRTIEYQKELYGIK